MSSFYNPLQRFYKFILKRLLGQFLSSELDLGQLDVALSSGDIRLQRLSLNPQQLNEWAEGLPVRVQSAHIAALHCRVPWKSLLSQHCTLHIRGLHVELAPIAPTAPPSDGRYGGRSLQDSVHGAINDGLQRLSHRQLRQQVRLHRQLARDIHSSHTQQQQQNAGGGGREMDLAAEERRLAELESDMAREERSMRRRRRRLKRLANKRAAHGRVRSQEGGNVDPDTDTDADTNDERTDEEGEEDSEAQQQQHAPSRGEAKEEELDEDIAAAGLRVVASFIERVVAMTEVTMDDITLALDCPLTDDADEQPHSQQSHAQRSVRLELHIQSLEYCDMSRVAAEALQSSSATSSAPPSSSSSSLPPLSAGPVFSYSKLIRLHGFHLTLRTADGEQLTIAHADVGQQCDVRVKVRMLDGGTVGETEVDVSSVRALLAPRQLAALHELADVLGRSSRLAARTVSAKREAERARQRYKERSSAGSGRAVESPSESEWSEGGARSPQKQRSGAQQPRAGTSAAQTAPSASSSPASPASPPSAAAPTPLWSVSVHLQHALVAVLEEDEAVRAEWWLEPVTLPHSSTTPAMVLSPLISGLSVDHLLLSLRHARVESALAADVLSSSVAVSELLVEEYLQQYRLLQSTLPSLTADGERVYEQQQQRVGFSVRRLMWFERPADSGEDGAAPQQPHMRCVLDSAVDGSLSVAADGQSGVEFAPTEVAVSSRVSVQLLPLHVDFDLGLLSRLSTLSSALSPPSALQAEPLSPSVLASSLLSSELSAAPSDALSLRMERTLSNMSNLSSSSVQLPLRSLAAADSRSSSILVSVRSVTVSVLFPADTASQAAVSTPLLRDGPADCFDSRGVVRGEGLVLHVDRLHCHSHSGQRGECPPGEQDSTWSVAFAEAAVDLLYPKEPRQSLHPPSSGLSGSAQATSAAITRSNPLHLHTKRILTTSYAQTGAQLSADTPPRPHSVTVTSRADRSPAAHSGPRDAIDSHAADNARQLEALFLNGLPTYRWFEPAEGSHTTGATAAAAATSSSAMSPLDARTSTALHAPSTSASAAYQFEQLSAAHSSLVLDVTLASASLHLSKVELDLVLLLYAIYDEVSTPPPPAAQPPPPRASPDSTAAQADGAAAHVSSSPSAALSAVGLSSSGASPSLFDSASDSDSSGSEMFESVLGAESVFFQHRSRHRFNAPHAAGQTRSVAAVHEEDEAEDEEQLAALSDVDSAELNSDGEDGDEELREAALHNSQFGMQSELMGRSQQLTQGQRKVTEATPSTAGGHADAPIHSTSLFSTLLAAPTLATASSAQPASDSLLFHSFVDQPASLFSSAVLPPASSFVPAPEQPYKFVKPPVHSSTASPHSARPSLPSQRHRLSFRLSVLQGGVCLQEEPVPLPLFSPLSAFAVPPSSLSPPHSFHLDVRCLHVFQCSKLDGKDVSYVSVRAADCTLREYPQPVVADELLTAPSVPLLFKTLQDRSLQQQQQHSASNSSLSAAAALWHDPVFVGQFIIAVSPSLHLRETTAALNLRALTLAYAPQSDWLAKLTDFFTLTAPPYVQTAGQPVALNAHYTDFAQQRQQQPPLQPQPPPLTQDLVKLAFHVYDACLDYNPADISARAVLLVDHFHLHTTLHPLSKHSDLAIELRDAALYLLPTSAKAGRAVTSSVRLVPPPHLHSLPAASVVSYLEELGCARVAVLDYLDARVQQQDAQHVDASQPLLAVALTNGELELLTCADSFATLLETASHLASALLEQREMREVVVTHFAQEQRAVQQQPPQQQAASAGAEAKYEERGDEQEEKELGLDRSGAESPPPLNLLQAVDSHLFGPDLGQTLRADSSVDVPRIVDAYCDEVKQATSISLALQAAAERELHKARRERQLNASIMILQQQEQQRDQRREAGAVRVQWQAPAALDEEEASGEQRAHWFSRSEMDMREVRDAMEQHSRTMPDEREAELEEQIDADRERRRRRQMDGGRQVSRKHQPMQPTVLEQHIAQPAQPRARSSIRSGTGSAVESGEEGAAQAAVRRFRLGEKTSGVVAESELLLHNVSVRWKVFDGSDWTDSEALGSPPHSTGAAQSGEQKYEAEEDVGEIEYGGEPEDEAHSKRHQPGLNERRRLSLSASPSSDYVVHGGGSVHENYVPTTMGRRSAEHVSGGSGAPSVVAPRHSPHEVAYQRAVPLVTPAVGRGVRRTDRMLELSLRGVHLLQQSFGSTARGELGSSASGNSGVGVGGAGECDGASGNKPVSSVSLAVQHVEVVDGIADSPYRLLLTSNTAPYQSTTSRPFPFAAHCAVRLDVLSVRSNERASASTSSELRVEVTLHPLRVAVDQDAVELLVAFFSRPITLHTPSASSTPPQERPAQSEYVADESFCQLFALTQPVQLTIDYHPRRVSYSALRHGDYAQLLHLFPLQKLTLQLPAITLTGLSLSAVGSHLATQWAEDISRNQLHHYLSAIQPLRSIVNVSSGVVECVLLPYSQYKRQGRVLRAVKRGVSSLAKHAAVEGLSLLLTLTSSANALLRDVDAIVAPGSRTASHATAAHAAGAGGSGGGTSSLAARSPDSFRAGLSVAYARLSASVHEVAHSLVAVPCDEWTRGGGRLGVLSVVRNLPVAALQPMIGVTDALHATIMAAQNTVDRTLAHERREMLKP